jgi:hypothetical protein
MTCSSCGAEIADRAIVCYRCGTPTAVPAALPPVAAEGRPRRGAALVLLIMAAALAAALAVVALGYTRSRGAWLIAAGVVLVIAAIAAVRSSGRPR